MNRDTQAALDRLEQALLEEEQANAQEELLPDTEEEEEDFGDLLEESEGQDPVVYRNFSNAYGKNLRNYATGYKAYNSDTTDTDLNAYSETVRTGEKPGSLWLPILVALLAAAAVAYMAWLFFGGMA